MDPGPREPAPCGLGRRALLWIVQPTPGEDLGVEPVELLHGTGDCRDSTCWSASRARRYSCMRGILKSNSESYLSTRGLLQALCQQLQEPCSRWKEPCSCRYRRWRTSPTNRTRPMAAVVPTRRRWRAGRCSPRIDQRARRDQAAARARKGVKGNQLWATRIGCAHRIQHGVGEDERERHQPVEGDPGPLQIANGEIGQHAQANKGCDADEESVERGRGQGLEGTRHQIERCVDTLGASLCGRRPGRSGSWTCGRCQARSGHRG